jgi:hypothetical protein
VIAMSPLAPLTTISPAIRPPREPSSTWMVRDPAACQSAAVMGVPPGPNQCMSTSSGRVGKCEGCPARNSRRTPISSCVAESMARAAGARCQFTQDSSLSWQ